MLRNNDWPGKVMFWLCALALLCACSANHSQADIPGVISTLSPSTATTLPGTRTPVTASAIPVQIVPSAIPTKASEADATTPLFHPPLSPDFDPNIILSMLLDRDGFLWTSGSEGLVQWDTASGSHTEWNSYQGLGGVNDMAQAADGSLWFATDHGLLHYQKGRWGTFTTASGLPDNIIFSIALTPDGAVWVASDDGISRLVDGSVTVFTETGTGQSLSGLWLLATGADGTLWAAGMSPMLVSFQKDHWEEVVQVPEGTGYISDLAVTPDGHIWLAGNNTLYQFNGTRWVGFNPWRTNSIGSARTLAVGSDGDLYVGLEVDCTLHDCYALDFDQREKMPGIYHYDGYQWNILNNEKGDMNHEVCSIQIKQDGVLWVGTCKDGVVRFDGESWQHFKVEK